MAVLTGGTREAYSAEASDQDIFTRLAHDVRECQKALEFIDSEGKRNAKEYWPNLLKYGCATASAFDELFGASALESEGLAELYERYDHRHSRSFDPNSVNLPNYPQPRHAATNNTSYTHSDSGPHGINGSARIHPKERSFSVPSLHSETAAYIEVTKRLDEKVSVLASDFLRLLTTKIKGISVHIGHIQARLKLRDSLYEKTSKLDKSVLKLEKKLGNASSDKTSAVEAELESTRLKYNLASAMYTALNTKLRATLPETMLLIEEFISNLTNWAIYQNRDIFKIVDEGLWRMCETHGFLDSDKHNKVHVQDAESIMGQWEAEATPSRLRIESLFFEDYEKNRGLLDDEISSENNPLAVAKVWLKLTTKKEKHHEVKAKDREKGIFHDHQMADPIKSYVQFNDPALNLSPIYYPDLPDRPEKTAERPLPELPPLADVPAHSPKSASHPPPPVLPPRDESRLALLKPVSGKPNTPFLPKTPPPSAHSWAGAHVKSHLKSNSIGGNGSLLLPRPELQFSSNSDGHTLNSLVDGSTSDNVFLKFANDKLVKLYNGSKNEITEAPITTLASSLESPQNTESTEANHSRTWQLSEIHKCYKDMQNARAVGENETLKAKASFAGEAPGDLSFKAGEKVEVLLDLQKDILTYEKSGENWFLGASVESRNGHKRVGYAPSTFF